MALNMDERCLVIEENGGTFHDEAPDMEKIVAEWLERVQWRVVLMLCTKASMLVSFSFPQATPA